MIEYAKHFFELGLRTQKGNSMTDKKEQLIRAMHVGYDKALSECKTDATLYVAGFIDGMRYQNDGTIPESEFSKALREFNIKKQ